MRKLLIILFFLPLFSVAQNNVYTFNAADGTPMKRYDTTFGGWNARVLVRQDQNYNMDSNEVLIDVVGLGEIGTDTTKLSVNGYGYWISNARWDGTVTLPSGNHHPIIVVLQPSSGWPGESTVDGKIDAVIGRWRIKKRAVHVSGLSMGGWTWTTYITGDAASPYPRAFKVTSVVESGGVIPTDNTPYPDLFDQFADFGARGSGGNLLSFQQRLDGRDALTRVNRMNTNHAGSFFIETNYGAEGHSNFNDHYNPATTNWTTSNAEVTSTTPAGGISYSMGQWQLTQGDTTTNWAGATPLTADAGADAAYIYDQGGVAVPFNLSGTSFNATSPTYSWSALAGNPASTTITNSSSATTTVTGANVPGFYGYELTVTDSPDSNKDTVYLQLRDWMQKNVTPCRSGGGSKFTIGNTVGGGVTTTEIYLPYINRNLFFGQSIQGGDTIVIVSNPNNSGRWNTIELGDFGGSKTCPVIVMADSVINYGSAGGYFRLAAQDSNAVVYTVIDGLANRITKGVVYGFRYKNTGALDVNGFALNANMVHHIEINGISAENVGVGLFIKKNSDSTKMWPIFDNYRLNNININNIFLYRVNGECFYVGHTDIAGNIQAGNNGPVIKGDSLTINRIIIDSAHWDGVQTSHFGEHTIIKNVLTNRTGKGDAGGQQWSIFIGGNTAGNIDSCAAFSGTGPLGFLGKGLSAIKNCIIDSIYTADLTADGIYAQMSLTGVPQPYDSAILVIENCIINRMQRYAINIANNSSTMKGDTIRNNIFVHPTKTTAQLINNNVTAKVETGNITVTGINYDTSSLRTMPAYRVYKELLLTNSPGTPISFYDLQPLQIIRGFRIKGRRIKFKTN